MWTRLVIPKPPPAMPAGADKPLPEDKPLSRVGKYVPAEVLAFFVTFSGIVEASNLSDVAKAWTGLGLILAGCIAIPVYINLRAEANQPKRLHMILSIIAFIVWSYAYGSPFRGLSIDGIKPVNSTLGAVFLGIFSLISAGLAPKYGDP